MLYDADGNLIGADVCAHLRQQLCTVTWFRNKRGRLQLIDKEELRKLIGMSPDIGDAAALTCLDRYTGDDPKINGQDLIGPRRQQIARWARMMG
jgi:hypothetical protein